MKARPKLEKHFYHDGRGPELQKVIWKETGVMIDGFEYFNPDDGYEETEIKYIKIIGLQAYSMATEEVHGNILLAKGYNSAINEIINSFWFKSLNQSHIKDCKHYQIMFYDEIYDVICKDIEAGVGRFNV